jgi:hypothetical protein
MYFTCLRLFNVIVWNYLCGLVARVPGYRGSLAMFVFPGFSLKELQTKLHNWRLQVWPKHVVYLNIYYKGMRKHPSKMHINEEIIQNFVILFHITSKCSGMPTVDWNCTAGGVLLMWAVRYGELCGRLWSQLYKTNYNGRGILARSILLLLRTWTSSRTIRKYCRAQYCLVYSPWNREES